MLDNLLSKRDHTAINKAREAKQGAFFFSGAVRSGSVSILCNRIAGSNKHIGIAARLVPTPSIIFDCSNFYKGSIDSSK